MLTYGVEIQLLLPFGLYIQPDLVSPGFAVFGKRLGKAT
jgi:hypothetical protein